MEQPSTLVTKKSGHSRSNGPSQMLGMPTFMTPSSIYEVQSVETLETLVVITSLSLDNMKSCTKSPNNWQTL